MGIFNKAAEKARSIAESAPAMARSIAESTPANLDVFGKKRIAELEQQVADAESLLSPQLKDAAEATRLLRRLQDQCRDQAEKIDSLTEKANRLDDAIAEKKQQLVTFDDELLVQEFGLYEPRYEATSSSQFKDRIKEVREHQKVLVKRGTACSGNFNWTVNNSKSQGTKMVKDVQKLLLRCFNVECDEVIGKVKYNNFDASEKRIRKAAESISKLGKTWDIAIEDRYIKLKIDELRLVLEHAQAKQQEKEELRALREAEREEAKLQKEIEAERKRLEKERTQYEKARADIATRLTTCPDAERAELAERLARISANIDEVEKGIENVDYRQANIRAGYVYIISNIGSFGEGIFKIGMTRRLDPTERVSELGDASVPFAFDVHAMIFTDDAPGLEAALHNRFADRKVNLVNKRREYFRVSLDEIKVAVKENFDKTVEFNDVPDAEQYRISEKMRAER
ncbi:DUF4041 domain-containing protein [Berryella wangjianweii]|nr:DUF4041 domain-containing protein [Berryella wangjianweii]